MNSTLNTKPCRVRADAEFTAVPLRSAIRPRLPSTTGCGNPPQPRSPGHAHWLPDSMPAPAMTVKPSDLWPPARPARRRPGSASRWSRHPPHRTHSHCPPRRRAPPPGQDAPAQANSPPRQRDAEPGRLRAGLAGGHRSPGFTVIAGAGMLSGSQCACPGDPACGGFPQPVVLGSRGLMAERSGTAVNFGVRPDTTRPGVQRTVHSGT